jgi:hypothetical protein
MKKLVLACMAMLFAIGAYAQSITIDNQKDCTVYFIIRGDVSGCGTSYQSGVLSLAASTPVTYGNPSLVPGGMANGGGTFLGSTGVFNQVEFYDDDPTASGTCYTTSAMVGRRAVCGFPVTNSISFRDRANGCVEYCDSVIDWVISGGNITVTVH